MTALRVIIADDEPLARSRMRRMLGEQLDVEIIAECANGKETVTAVHQEKPDLLFLDVEMPEMDGFEVIHQIGAELPYIVFVTAYNQYAIRAFEVYALDYLLKPYSSERLARALNRARERLIDDSSDKFHERVLQLLDEFRGKSRYIERLVIKDERRIWFMPVNRVDWFEADGKYIQAHAGKESHLLRESLSSMEERLDPKNFARIHRSTIVNINSIHELQPWFHGDYRILLKNGTELILSRTYRKQFRDLLGD